MKPSTISRRSALAAFFAPLVAKFLPKMGRPRKVIDHISPLVTTLSAAAVDDNTTVRVTDFWPRENRCILFVDREYPTPSPSQIDEAMRRANAMIGEWSGKRLIRIMNPDGSVRFTNINS